MGPFCSSRPDMKQGLLALTLLLLFCGVFAQTICRYNAGGCDYDFSSLMITDGSSYYEFNDTDASSGAGALGFYELNICAPVTNTGCDAFSGVCQTSDGSSYSCGVANNNFQALSQPAAGNCPGASLQYLNGTFCNGIGAARETTINLICNQTATTAFISSVTEQSPCKYLIEMQSIAACGTTVSSISPTISATASATVSASATMSATATMSAAPSVVNGTTYTVTNSATSSATSSATATMSMSMGMVNNSTNSTNGAAPAPASSSDGGLTWIWWVVGGIAIVVIVAAVGAAGFVVYKKKQQSYDSIG